MVCPLGKFGGGKDDVNGLELTSVNPFHNTLKVAIPMVIISAAINGLVARQLGQDYRTIAAIGGTIAYTFFLSDYICHSKMGQNYQEKRWVLILRQIINLSLNFFFFNGMPKKAEAIQVVYSKAWTLLLPFALCQMVETFYLHAKRKSF